MTIAIIEKMMVMTPPTASVMVRMIAGGKSSPTKTTEPMITRTVSASRKRCAGLARLMMISIMSLRLSVTESDSGVLPQKLA